MTEKKSDFEKWLIKFDKLKPLNEKHEFGIHYAREMFDEIRNEFTILSPAELAEHDKVKEQELYAWFLKKLKEAYWGKTKDRVTKKCWALIQEIKEKKRGVRK